MKRLVAVLFLTLVACDKSTTPPAQPETPDSGRADAAKSAEPAALQSTGPTVRVAAPHKIIAMRLDRMPPAGKITEKGQEPKTLLGIGLNVCQTGWMLQAYFKAEDELVSTPPFLIQLAEVPTGRAFVYRDPDIKSSHLALDFETFGLDRVKGTMRLVDEASGADTLKLEIDAEPTSVAAAPGVGPQGCYSTGYFKANNKQGPAVAVWDGHDNFYLGMQLTPTQSLTVEFAMRGSQRQPENLIQASLAQVFRKPDGFPFRVNFETRANNAPVGEDVGPSLVVKKQPVEKGRIQAAFLSNNPEGPIRVMLSDVTVPDGFGDLSGQTLDFRAEALFVSDLKGKRVPIAVPPQWETVTDAAPTPKN